MSKTSKTNRTLGPCTCTTTLTEVAGILGGDEGYAHGRAAAYDYEVATDPAGRAVLPAPFARELVAAVLAERQAHDAKWTAYQDYLAQRRQDAEAERQAAIDKARSEARDYAVRYGKRAAEQAEKDALAAAEQALAERAEKAGKPVPWDKFARSA